MISDMWEEFANVIDDNPGESFSVDIYTTTKAPTATGAVVEQLVHKFWTKSLWIYPKEQMPMEFMGKVYTVEGIFLFKPDVPIKIGDIILASHRPNNIYRCGGVIDPVTHIEALCFSPKGLSFNNVPKTRYVMVDTVIV